MADLEATSERDDSRKQALAMLMRELEAIGADSKISGPLSRRLQTSVSISVDGLNPDGTIDPDADDDPDVVEWKKQAVKAAVAVGGFLLGVLGGGGDGKKDCTTTTTTTTVEAGGKKTTTTTTTQTCKSAQ